MSWIIRYQITVWHKNGTMVCRAKYEDLKTAKTIARFNSKVYDVAHVVIKRLRRDTEWMLKTSYYDLVGAYEEGVYFSRLQWRKAHPFLHAAPGMAEKAARIEAEFQKFLTGG